MNLFSFLFVRLEPAALAGESTSEIFSMGRVGRFGLLRLVSERHASDLAHPTQLLNFLLNCLAHVLNFSKLLLVLFVDRVDVFREHFEDVIAFLEGVDRKFSHLLFGHRSHFSNAIVVGVFDGGLGRVLQNHELDVDCGQRPVGVDDALKLIDDCVCPRLDHRLRPLLPELHDFDFVGYCAALFLHLWTHQHFLIHCVVHAGQVERVQESFVALVDGARPRNKNRQNG